MEKLYWKGVMDTSVYAIFVETGFFAVGCEFVTLIEIKNKIKERI
jgi:hypothetical protein